MVMRVLPPDEAKRKARANLAAWKRQKELARMKDKAGGLTSGRSARSKTVARGSDRTSGSPEAESKEMSPNMRLWRAIQRNDLEGVKDAIAAGAELTSNRKRKNALASAAASSSPEIVRHLISIGMDVNGRIGNGAPLISAAAKGKLENAKILIDAGADVNLSPPMSFSGLSGETALTIAAWNRHEDILALLLRNGAKVDVQGEHGDTALMIAAVRGNRKIARMLINAGADMTLRNSEGRTAEEIAVDLKHTQIAKMLRDIRLGVI